MLDDFEKNLLLITGLCGKSRGIRDASQENVTYAEDIKSFSRLMKGVIESGNPHKNLLAEKYCIIFQRNYCTTTVAEQDKLNDQLMKLADAVSSVNLVMDPEKYREFTQDSLSEIREGRVPYHGCAVFVKTQIDTLNRSGQGTGIDEEKELWKLRKENLRVCRDAFEVLQEEALFNNNPPELAPEPQNTELPNMAEVEAAENKVSMLQSLDRSADGMSSVEGKDIDSIEEGYMAAVNEVKYEAQEARTANNEAKSQSPKVGQKVTFQIKGQEAKVNGTVEQLDEKTVTIRCGNLSIPFEKERLIFKSLEVTSEESTQKYAREKAMQSLGTGGKVLLAKHKGSYSGKIIGKTSTFAIQKVNDNTAVLHRLKDLEGKEKDAQGLIKEGNDVTITRDGANISLSRLEPGEHEKDKVRTQQKTRGSIER